MHIYLLVYVQCRLLLFLMNLNVYREELGRSKRIKDTRNGIIYPACLRDGHTCIAIQYLTD